MPSYEVGEPLVAEVTYRAQGSYGLALGFNRAWTELGSPFDGQWRTERVYLGEVAYGGAVTVRLVPESNGDDGPIPESLIDPPIRIYIDDLELTTSSACRRE
jgi:hypothetical protein